MTIAITGTDSNVCFASLTSIAEQGYFQQNDRVAVIGDGKLGLLIAQAIAAHGVSRLTIFGRHPSKMALVEGAVRVLASAGAETVFTSAFDVCIDATGKHY